MRKIVIYGAGGLGSEVACLIKSINDVSCTWDLLGFLDDDPSLHGHSLPYGKVLGDSEWINSYPDVLSVVIAVGNPSSIKIITEKIENPLVDYPNIISPGIHFLDRKSCLAGRGNILFPGSLISCNVQIGNFNILNVCIQLGHDVRMGDYNVIMPSCNVSGGVVIGDQVSIGVKSVVLQYLNVASETTIAPGSVLTRNTRPGVLYMGNPARKIVL